MPVAARHFKDARRVVCAIFVWLVSALLLVSAAVAVVLMVMVDRSYGVLFLVSMAVYIGVRVLRFAMGRRLSCPLCHGSILQKKKCRMHRDARKLGFLNYTQSLLMDAALHGRFTCQYCGTPFRLLR